jgi:hypothetical protein
MVQPAAARPAVCQAIDRIFANPPQESLGTPISKGLSEAAYEQKGTTLSVYYLTTGLPGVRQCLALRWSNGRSRVRCLLAEPKGDVALAPYSEWLHIFSQTVRLCYTGEPAARFEQTMSGRLETFYAMPNQASPQQFMTLDIGITLMETYSVTYEFFVKDAPSDVPGANWPLD